MPTTAASQRVEEFTRGSLPGDAFIANAVRPVSASFDLVNAAPTSQTALTSSSPAQVEPSEVSVENAMSTPFVDLRTLGTQTWPIHGTQKWEGRILEVDNEFFSAELTSLAGPENDTLISEFRTKHLETDGQKIQPGDLFYMTARQVRLRGLLTTSYSLQLRRPGNWTAADVHDIKERARRRFEMIQDNVE